MPRYIDASIVVEVLIEGPLAESCTLILERIQNGTERAITNLFTIAEIHHILALREKKTLPKVEEAIEAFLQMKGLSVVSFEPEKIREALRISTRYDIDFVDATHKVTMQEMNLGSLYSLDSHFDKFKDIQRMV